jgi:hypothetical protein
MLDGILKPLLGRSKAQGLTGGPAEQSLLRVYKTVTKKIILTQEKCILKKTLWLLSPKNYSL